MFCSFRTSTLTSGTNAHIYRVKKWLQPFLFTDWIWIILHYSRYGGMGIIASARNCTDTYVGQRNHK